VGYTWPELMDLDSLRSRYFVFKSLGTNADVLCKSSHQIVCHMLQAGRAKHLQGFCPAHNPRSQNQFCVTERVITMKMCDKDRFWPADRQAGCIHPSHDAGACVKEQETAIAYNCGCWS